jgi:transcriptional regulator with XRE-family HTH domain
MGRKYRRQTQQELADAITEATGSRWSRVMVGYLETGKKELNVDTLMVIADIHRLPYSFYLESPDGSEARGVYVNSDPACAQGDACPLYAGDGGSCLRGVDCLRYTPPMAAVA